MNRCLTTGAFGLLMLTSGCAGSIRDSTVATLSFPLPEAATQPCRFPTLPQPATTADLELGYVARGSALLECDLARQLAVDTLSDLEGRAVAP